MPSLVYSSPNPTTDPTSSIDIGASYYTFSNNGNTSAASNMAHSNILSTDFTIETWVNYYSDPLNPANVAYIPYLVGNMSPTALANYWSFGLTANRQLSFYMNANNTMGTAIYTQSNAVPINTWTHIGVSFVNATKSFTLYVNGVAQSNLLTNYATYVTIANSSATSATCSPVTHVGTGFGSLILGSLSTSNNPAYIHDFKMVTGTSYTPSVTLPMTSTTGTRLLMRAAATTRNVVVTTPSIPANSWQRVTFNIPGETLSTWATSSNAALTMSLTLGAASSNVTTSLGGWNSFNAYSSNNTQLYTQNSNAFMAAQGNAILVTGMQLETGSNATPFEYRLFANELRLCQRYFEKSYDLTTVPGTAFTVGANLANIPGAHYKIAYDANNFYDCGYTNTKVDKRAAEKSNITLYSMLGTSNATYNGTSAANFTSARVVNAGPSTFKVIGGGGMTLNHSHYFHWTYDAEF